MFIRETIDNTALGLALRKPEPSPANAVKINAEIKIMRGVSESVRSIDIEPRAGGSLTKRKG